MTSFVAASSSPAPEWTCHLADTVTGRLLGESPYVGVPTYEFGVNIPGKIGIIVPLRSMGLTATEARNKYESWRVSLVLAYGSWIAQAGPIVSKPYVDRTGQLHVAAGGLWSLLYRRVHRNTTWAGNLNDESADLVYADWSLQTLAKKAIQRATMLPYGSLPIVYPADLPGTVDRRYAGYEAASVGERLAKLTEEDNGPDVELRPRFTTDRGGVQWEARIGNPQLGTTTAQQGWDYGAGLQHLDVDDNAANQADTVYVKGNGSSYATPFGVATDTTLPAAGHPALDYVDTGSMSEGDPATLASIAAADLKLLSRPVETWSGTIRADGRNQDSQQIGPSLGQFSAGDVMLIGVQDHLYVADGHYQRRVLAVSNGDTSDTATIRLAPSLGGA